MTVRIEDSWQQALSSEFAKPYFVSLSEKVRAEYLKTELYPPAKDVFAAFDHTPLPTVKVVILGQDPYHGQGQAHGLAFSVQPGVTIPPSLQNIYKEINSDLGRPSTTHGDLTPWANSGVLLLNSTLTVRPGLPGSHQTYGWETFTDTVIKTVSHKRSHVVFLLWGSFAIKKSALIDSTKHLILTAPHPSPFSAHRGFFGCRHFSQCNEYLTTTGQGPINW